VRQPNIVAVNDADRDPSGPKIILTPFSMDDYRVELDIYNGPLDLLLYLIRRDEIDIHDIPILRITTQFIAYVELLKRIDPEAIGDFLVMAATLMEIKSRSLLPTPPPEEDDGEFVDPRVELVRQLLEYKSFKDAARAMEVAAKIHALRHPRDPVLPEPPADEVDLDDVEVWDLLDAFNRLLEQTGKRRATHQVDFDDTPLLIYIDDVLDTVERAGGTVKFAAIFEGRSLAAMIGLFLALLELIRQRRVRATQDEPFGAITIILLDPTPVEDVSEAYAWKTERDPLLGGELDAMAPDDVGDADDVGAASAGEDDREEDLMDGSAHDAPPPSPAAGGGDAAEPSGEGAAPGDEPEVGGVEELSAAGVPTLPDSRTMGAESADVAPPWRSEHAPAPVDEWTVERGGGS